uniref:Sodium-dependent nutrient amino acid transporter 1 n=1 Tax=Megaselia scalaris TaxID=36166 RepID=T1GG38_MEGSC
MSRPYIVMIILLIRSMTLPGALDGVIFFLKPQWDKLLEAKVWYAAVTQVFFSLAIFFGGIIMYSSYNRFGHNIYKDVTIVTTLDTFTSLLSGIIIFGILGNLAYEKGRGGGHKLWKSFLFSGNISLYHLLMEIIWYLVFEKK